MNAGPTPTAVTRPFEPVSLLTRAVPVDDEVQCTDEVIGSVERSSNVPVAVNCWAGALTVMLVETAAVTSRDFNTLSVTVSTVVPDTPLNNVSVAVMVTVPVIVPVVTRPREIVAIEGFRESDTCQVSVGDDIRLCVTVAPDHTYDAIAAN